MAVRYSIFCSVQGRLDGVTEWQVDVYSEFGFNLSLDDQTTRKIASGSSGQGPLFSPHFQNQSN